MKNVEPDYLDLQSPYLRLAPVHKGMRMGTVEVPTKQVSRPADGQQPFGMAAVPNRKSSEISYDLKGLNF